MPNMSRRSLHRDVVENTLNSSHRDAQYIDTVTKEVYHHDTKLYEPTRLEPRKLFEEEIQYSFFTRITCSISKVITRVFMSIVMILYAIHQTSTQALIWSAEKFYRLASRVLLFDNWLSQDNPIQRRRIATLFSILSLLFFILIGKF